MLETAEKTIKRFKMIEYGDKIVASLSGGPDSSALLFFLIGIKEEYSLKLYAVHVNHMIRNGEAERDERFVEMLCAKNNVELLSFKKNVPEMAKEQSVSIEEAGRASRLEALRQAVSSFSADKAATGHNKNDNAETLLMRLSRGSGPKGLSGIAPISDMGSLTIIRPLIECSRGQIGEYCALQNIPHVTDSTNCQTVYTRNKIRLELIPWLKENLNSDIIDALTASSEIMREQNEFLERIAKKAYNECAVTCADSSVRLCIKSFEKNDLAIKRLIVREALKNAGGGLKDITKSHSDDILALSKKGTGKKLCLPGGVLCKTEYGDMVFGRFSESLGYDYELLPGNIVYIKEEGVFATFSDRQLVLKYKNLCTKSVKCDKILFKLNYRTRRPGDRLKLPGGTKKLSDYFIDNKTPVEERNRAALIADGSDVLSVLGVCDSERIKRGKHEFFIQLWEVPGGEY